ncbi:uncharacterized protein LOC141672581 [Apium graveolens]|uniref:uncharacterized protein LOC141672581 n=1 Tax=Apium graveolens TaxID=4045 RepID=UPI003D7BC34D
MYVLVKGDGATPRKKSPLLSRIFLGCGVGFANQGSNVLDINWLAYSGVPLTTTLAFFCSNTGLQKNDKRERVVKASPDITINSIKVIFQVHRFVEIDGGKGFDRVRWTEIGKKYFKLTHLEEGTKKTYKRKLHVYKKGNTGVESRRK